MRVLLTGASGWIGSVIARDLMAAGHSVVGLVRSNEKGQVLAVAGGTPLIGSLGDLGALRRAAADADRIIHTASVWTCRRSINWPMRSASRSRPSARSVPGPSGRSS